MRAVMCDKFGSLENLVVRDIDAARPGPGEISVAVKAAALNFFDTLLVTGKYQIRPKPPFSPGAELAGIVEQVGEGVSKFKPGDRVAGYLGHGACRDQVSGGERNFVKLPDDVDFTHAAGLIVTYGTTLHALRERGKVVPGETVAVLGAAGGTGQAAIELAKVLGARVIACASSDDKLDFCRSIGADETVNYETENLKERLKALAGGRGVDVVYDPVGGRYCDPALRACAWDGRYLVVGFAGGDIPRPPLNLVLLKGCSIVGVFWGSYIEREPARLPQQMAEILQWQADGVINPHIHGTYPLEETAKALQAIARREVKGKVIIAP